jgi:hypothetical protein
MKMYFIATTLVSVAAQDPEPAVLELVGVGAEVRYDTGSILQYTDGDVTQGVHIDSTADGGCTRVDNVCVSSQFLAIETQLSEHADHVHTVIPQHIASLNTTLPQSIADMETTLNERLDELSEAIDTLTTTQTEISNRLTQVEADVVDIQTTDAPTAAPTSSPTAAPTSTAAPGLGEAESTAASSCWDILGADNSAPSGQYWIDSVYGQPGSDPIQVYCDMETDGGGWTLVEKGATQGCFVSAVGTVTSPTQESEGKFSDAAINNLLHGQNGVASDNGVIRWKHGSPNWKDYSNDGMNAVPAATKIFFQGQVMSSSNVENRAFGCGNTPSGSAAGPFDSSDGEALDSGISKSFTDIDGYSIHYGFDTFQNYATDSNYGESLVRNCGVVEQENLLTDGVDNRHCAGNHFCKDVKNYGNQVLQSGEAGLGSYFIGCYGEYNQLPAETSGCQLGGPPDHCLVPDTSSEDCGVRSLMDQGWCNGINWDVHAHGGCTEGYEGPELGCRHTNGAPTPANANGMTWPAVATESMTMWVRPVSPVAQTFGLPKSVNGALCRDLEDPSVNQATANAFCGIKGFDRAQSWQTVSAADQADAGVAANTANGAMWSSMITGFHQTEMCSYFDSATDSWQVKSGQSETYRLVRVECVRHA